MTLSKLSLRNAKRQARDYLVYFVTVVMAAGLLYSFNELVFSQEVQQLSEGMNTLPLVIVLASIVVVCHWFYALPPQSGTWNLYPDRFDKPAGSAAVFSGKFGGGRCGFGAGTGVGWIAIPSPAGNFIRYVQSALSFRVDALLTIGRTDPVLLCPDISPRPSEKPEAHPKNENIRSHLL